MKITVTVDMYSPRDCKGIVFSEEFSSMVEDVQRAEKIAGHLGAIAFLRCLETWEVFNAPRGSKDKK